MRHLVVGIDDRGGFLSVHHAALGRRDGDRPPAAGIGRDQAIGIDDHLQRGIDAGGGDAERGVHRPRHGAVRACEIRGDVIAGLGQCEADGESLPGHAIAVDDVRKPALPIGHAAQRLAHHHFGIVEHGAHDPQQLRRAVFLGQPHHALHAAPVGRDLRAHIAQPLRRRADIGEDDRFHIRVRLAVAIEPHRRQAQPLAVDLGDRAVAAGRGAADIGPMRAHAAEAQQLAAMEGGHHDVHIGQVRAAAIGVVVDEDVAFGHIGEGSGDAADGIGHGAQMDRQIRPLRHHLPGGVEQAAGIIPGHLQQRRIGGFGEDDLHLLGGRDQGVLHHLEAGGVDAGKRIGLHRVSSGPGAGSHDRRRGRSSPGG